MHPVRHADLPESYPPTGEPGAGDLPVRFGGRGKAYLCPYPYRHPKVPSRRVRCDSCRSAHRFNDWSDEISNTKTETETMAHMSTRNTSGIRCARSYRTLRDGSFAGRFPRHFVPGYDRCCPSGTRWQTFRNSISLVVSVT